MTLKQRTSLLRLPLVAFANTTLLALAENGLSSMSYCQSDRQHELYPVAESVAHRDCSQRAVGKLPSMEKVASGELS